MNKNALTKIKMKNNSYHRYLRTKDKEDYNQYAKHRNQAKAACRKAISDYEKMLSKEVKSNPKDFFAYAKNKLNYSKPIPDLKEGDKIITSNEDKAALFNSYFTSVFTNENDNTPYFETTCISSISDVSFTTDQIEKKLKNLNPFKSPGADCLHPRVLKELSKCLSSPLVKIFTKSFEEGKVPQDWKDAIIIPLHKKDEKYLVSNYRPISLTSII